MSLKKSQLSLNWSGHTDCGRVRKNNEDSFLGLSLHSGDVRHLGKIGEAREHSSDYVFAVSDGMGGAMAGEFASKIAIEKITKILPSCLLNVTRALEKQENFNLLEELFSEIHRALLFLGGSYEECQGMGATLSLCWVKPQRLYFAHIGDSRIYHLPQAGGITQISEDDTHVGWLFRQGTLNEREAKSHPRRTCLQKALGADHQFINPQVGVIDYTSGDRFLLCTDGVTDGLFDQQVLNILTTASVKSPSHQLVDEAIIQSGHDNATAMVIEIL